MREIPLTKGYVAFVDDEDFERLSQHKWTAVVTGKHIKRVYAYRRTSWDKTAKRQRGCVYMHREIMNAPAGMDIDHQDGNTLRNLKSNLRCGTRSQNLANNRRSLSGTGLRGVTLTARGEIAPYRAMCRGKYLGSFHDKFEAAKAYDIAAVREFGSFAKLNFPMAELLAS